MLKSFPLVALAGAVFVAGGESAEDATLSGESFAIKEEAATIEYTVTSGEAVVVFEAESEQVMRGIEVCRPDGRPVLRLVAGHGQESRISGFVVESGEGPPSQVLAQHGEGLYGMSAIAADGSRATGGAELSHALLPAPLVVYPEEGDVGVPTNATVRWVPDPAAVEYRIVLEQDENDGLTARLPAGSSSFQIPPGVLRSQELSHVEVGAVGDNGNVTQVEIEFVTL